MIYSAIWLLLGLLGAIGHRFFVSEPMKLVIWFLLILLGPFSILSILFATLLVIFDDIKI